jgi:hypothetical protein
VDLYLHSPKTPSWRGAQKKPQGANLPLPFTFHILRYILPEEFHQSMYVCMCLHTKFHMPGFSISLVIVNKLKVKYRFRGNIIILFCVLEKERIISTKVFYFLNINFRVILQYYTLKVNHVAPISELLTTAMIVLSDCRKLKLQR